MRAKHARRAGRSCGSKQVQRTASRWRCGSRTSRSSQRAPRRFRESRGEGCPDARPAVQAGGSARVAKLGEPRRSRRATLGSSRRPSARSRPRRRGQEPGRVAGRRAHRQSRGAGEVERARRQVTSQVAALEAENQGWRRAAQSLATDRLGSSRRPSVGRRRRRPAQGARRRNENAQPVIEPAARIENRPPPDVPVVTSWRRSRHRRASWSSAPEKKSGLEVGHLLSVTRDGRPVGRVRVIRTYDDLAGAEVVETAPGETLARNDRATTAPSPASPGPQSPPRVAPPLPGAGVVEGK
jgi:hypothetical protein